MIHTIVELFNVEYLSFFSYKQLIKYIRPLNKLYKEKTDKIFLQTVYELIDSNPYFSNVLPDQSNCRVLHWNVRFLGITSYIDQIKPSDVDNAHVSIGIDEFSRPYVAIYASADTVITLFQRYSDCQARWVWGSCGSTYEFGFTSGNDMAHNWDMSQVLFDKYKHKNDLK